MTKEELRKTVIRDLHLLGTDLSRRAVGVITDLIREVNDLKNETKIKDTPK